MTWNHLDPALQAVAAEALSDVQLAAWKLELAGWGTRRIAVHLRVSHSAARDRLFNAHHNLARAGITQDASGNYHLAKEPA